MLASLEVKGAAIDASPSLTWSGLGSESGLGLGLRLGGGLILDVAQLHSTNRLGVGVQLGLGLGLGLGSG